MDFLVGWWMQDSLEETGRAPTGSWSLEQPRRRRREKESRALTICRDCRFGVVTLVLRPISRCSLAAKPLRFRQPSMVIAMMEGEVGGGGSGCRCSVSVSVSGVNVDCGCGSAEVWAYVCVWVFTKVC